MVIDVEETPEQEEEVEDKFKEFPLEGRLRIKTPIQDPPTHLEMKPLQKHLEYAFWKKILFFQYLYPLCSKTMKRNVLFSFSKITRKRLLGKYTILRALAFFCKHKINFEDDAKLVIQRQRRLNPNVKGFVKKRLSNFSMLEKCHFMVTEGIVLGHKASSAGLEVDKEKIDVIAKIPPPNNVKVVRSFLGHVRYGRRSIKDFSKISRLMTKLLEKDSVFDFNKECIKAFKTLKEKLMNAPIMVSPDWSQLFELMCDASDFAVGFVLGQREGRHFHHIHFASKTLKTHNKTIRSVRRNYLL
uniref:Reverse transcriptase domain-containing protein n=1 Tax=Tanacetum cinerariifolium TaxID=118510 RepID=A0A6L2JIZ3_TANCI|nr:reverse transcriptase domain-containing protein [Tanacetum cinerariifolium]